jgi:hypothetical protein
MDSYLNLALSSYFITITEFMDPDGYPRKPLSGQQSERSMWGSRIRYGWGTVRSNPYTWQFNGVLAIAQARQLFDLYWYHKDLVDRQQANAEVTCTDTTQEFREKFPRTRGKAPSPFDAVQTVGASVVYFAQFYVDFVQEPVVLETLNHGELGRAEVINISLEETGKKVAP